MENQLDSGKHGPFKIDRVSVEHELHKHSLQAGDTPFRSCVTFKLIEHLRY